MEATEMLAGTWRNEEKMHSFNIKGKPTKLCMMAFAKQSPCMHSPLYVLGHSQVLHICLLQPELRRVHISDPLGGSKNGAPKEIPVVRLQLTSKP
jgi:hypothetical protein